MPNIGATGGSIPAGGTSGQVLNKNTGTDYDASWAAAAPGQPPWTGNRWYTKAGAVNTASGSTFPTAQGGIAFIPVYVPNPCTITTLGIYVPSTGFSYRFALYTDNPASASYGPTNMVGTQASGTAAAGSYLNAAVGWTIPSAAVYWIAFGYSANVTMFTWAPALTMYGVTPSPAAAAPTTHLYTTAYTYSSTLPASMASVAIQFGTGIEPLFGFKAT